MHYTLDPIVADAPLTFVGARSINVTSSSVCIASSMSTARPSSYMTFHLSEEANGRTQWEIPTLPGEIGQPGYASVEDQQYGSAPQAAPSHSKRRQYAAGQTQAYVGAGGTASEYIDPSLGVQQPGGQLFTPGLSASDGFQQQQQQPPYISHEQQGIAPSQLANQFGQMSLQGGQQAVRVDYPNICVI